MLISIMALILVGALTIAGLASGGALMMAPAHTQLSHPTKNKTPEWDVKEQVMPIKYKSFTGRNKDKVSYKVRYSGEEGDFCGTLSNQEACLKESQNSGTLSGTTTGLKGLEGDHADKLVKTPVTFKAISETDMQWPSFPEIKNQDPFSPKPVPYFGYEMGNWEKVPYTQYSYINHTEDVPTNLPTSSQTIEEQPQWEWHTVCWSTFEKFATQEDRQKWYDQNLEDPDNCVKMQIEK